MRGVLSLGGSIALGLVAWRGVTAQGDNADLERSFRAWADSVEVQSFACRFTAELEGSPAGQEPGRAGDGPVVGEWRISLLPSPRQFLSFRLSDQEGECSWDSLQGEGRIWAKVEGSTQANGSLLNAPPKTFGYCEYPSDLFFLINDGRPIRRHLEMVDFEARRLEGSKAAFFLKHRDRSHFLAYIMDLSAAQPILELRMYVGLYEGAPLRNPGLGSDLELPRDFPAAVCFSKKRVLASTTRSGRSVPIQWTVEYALVPPDARYRVSLDPATLRIDEPLRDEELTARWPDGTEVLDTVSGKSFSVVGETRVEARVISEAMLESILAEAGLPPRPGADGRPTVTGCGANVLYLALRLLGKEADLRGLCSSLGIEVNQQLSSLEALVATATSLGCGALAVEGGKELLRSATRHEPVLLHVRKVIQGKDTGLWHYALVDDYDAHTGTLRVLDPPFKPARSPVSDVQAIWTGKALVFAGTPAHAVATRPVWRSPTVIALGLCVAAGVLFLALGRRRPGRARLATAGVQGVLVAALLAGCGEVAPGEGLRVVGGSTVDLGRVRRSSSNLHHRFEVENARATAVSIRDIRSTCSCISVSAETRSLAPGQRTGVRLELDTKLVVGRRKATAMLVLDRGDPVLLSLEAFVESSYNVAVSPGVWTLPADLRPGATVQRTLRITEFLPSEVDESESTLIEPEDESLRITELRPWKCQGFNAQGYVREREVVVTYAAPTEVTPRNWPISFKFSRKGESPDGSGELAFAQVLMNQL